jgi:hypothetical protein
MFDFLAKRWVYIDEDSLWVGPTDAGTPYYMNAAFPPDDPAAETNFDYLTCDGSFTMPYVSPFSET